MCLSAWRIRSSLVHASGRITLTPIFVSVCTQERRAADGTILAVERAIPYEPMYIILSELKFGGVLIKTTKAIQIVIRLDRHVCLCGSSSG